MWSGRAAQHLEVPDKLTDSIFFPSAMFVGGKDGFASFICSYDPTWRKLHENNTDFNFNFWKFL